MSLASPAPLRLCLVDMNNGVPNEAMRCFRHIVEAFVGRVHAENPALEVRVSHVQPRNLGEVPPDACDLYLSTGGPGSPFEGYDLHWCTAYRSFLDGIVNEQLRRGDCSRAVLVICHSFEIAIEHFGFAAMAARPERKFGLMPVYPTEAGQRAPLLAPFGDRFFAWEHREWQAVGLDTGKLERLGGELWARESRDGVSKGEGLLAFRFAPGIEGTQFHPEADKAGALAWILRPEQTKACIAAYGELTYQRMLRSLEDPARLQRTFELLIPGWLVRRYNALAPERGWREVAAPAA
jgi:GMP synthase-like glutamine amidotransferase